MNKNTRNSPIMAIRRKCLNCMCGQVGEVSRCPILDCDLWPYRYGVLPDTARKRGKVVDSEALDGYLSQKKLLPEAISASKSAAGNDIRPTTKVA